MRLTRQLDSCLNTQKVFLHTPKESEMKKKDFMKDLLPMMYVRILEQSSSRIQTDITVGFSYFMESYETAQDKEQVLRNMFLTVFAEVSLPAIEPWAISVGEENL
jgi:hypothetical protein